MSVLTNKVLVLNKTWTPVGTCTLQRAIIMLFSTYADNQPKAKIIEPSSYATFTWEDWSRLRPKEGEDAIATSNVMIRCPEVILLTRYEKFPKPKSHFSRRTLYKRDNYTCQYCGCKPGTAELTIDHVLPKSQGGHTTWENTALACVECNSRKANRTPEQAGMKLLKVPAKPKMSLFKCDLVKPIKSWEAFLGEAFWNVELKD